MAQSVPLWAGLGETLFQKEKEPSLIFLKIYFSVLFSSPIVLHKTAHCRLNHVFHLMRWTDGCSENIVSGRGCGVVQTDALVQGFSCVTPSRQHTVIIS